MPPSQVFNLRRIVLYEHTVRSSPDTPAFDPTSRIGKVLAPIGANLAAKEKREERKERFEAELPHFGGIGLWQITSRGSVYPCFRINASLELGAINNRNSWAFDISLD